MPVGGGGAWPGFETTRSATHSNTAPPVRRAPEGPEGTGGLRDDAPSEARGADGSRAGRTRGGRRSGGVQATKTPEPEAVPGSGGGGWGIRTPEGLHPTRFPSVRHRPLGESSVHIVPDNHKRKMSSRANPGQWSRSQAVISRKKGSHGAQTHRDPNSRASKLRQCDTHRRTHRRGDGTRAGRPGLVD